MSKLKKQTETVTAHVSVSVSKKYIDLILLNMKAGDRNSSSVCLTSLQSRQSFRNTSSTAGSNQIQQKSKQAESSQTNKFFFMSYPTGILSNSD